MAATSAAAINSGGQAMREGGSSWEVAMRHTPMDCGSLFVTAVGAESEADAARLRLLGLGPALAERKVHGLPEPGAHDGAGTPVGRARPRAHVRAHVEAERAAARLIPARKKADSFDRVTAAD